MSANRTPGPWEAVKWTCHAATTIRAGDVTIAECSGHGRYSTESEGDARLIAAAPDLLEVAETAMAVLNAGGVIDLNTLNGLVSDRLRAAIGKAKGGAA